MNNSLWESDVLLFSEFINSACILFYDFVEFIILLHTFLVISFAKYKECTICLISRSKFSNVLSAFTCVRAIGNLWSICFGFNLLTCLRSKTLATRAMFKVSSKSFTVFLFIKVDNFFQQYRLLFSYFGFQGFFNH